MTSSMLAVTAPSFCEPSAYELSTIPQPVVTEPTNVVFRVHAASINPVDVKKAAGVFKLAVKEKFVENPGHAMILPTNTNKSDSHIKLAMIAQEP